MSQDYNAICSFLYREARLLDDRQWDEWLDLYSESVEYWMPAWDDDDRLTDAGRMLRRIYNELDLVAAECIRRDVFEGLDPAQLAAVLSTLVFESRPRRSAFSWPTMRPVR